MHYNFDLDLAEGQIAEKQLQRLLAGKIEVKRDKKSMYTGNIAVEFECRGKPSGISTTEARTWAFWLEKERAIVFVPTSKLKKMIKNRPFVVGGDEGSETKMYLINKKELLEETK